MTDAELLEGLIELTESTHLAGLFNSITEVPYESARQFLEAIVRRFKERQK